MKGVSLIPIALAALASGTLEKRRSTLTPITTEGNAFMAGNKRFYLRGVAYQPGGASANLDPLADPKICLRDIKDFEKLGINTIRVYSVDNSKDHDECMAALDKAGIYVVLDLNTPKYSIHRGDPHLSYNADYLESVFATVEMFAKYDNVAAFFSGNEVINDEEDTDKSAPYVKAVTRDARNYISSRGLRKVPVGYSAADVSKNRMQTAEYFNCGSDDMRSDFFAFNDYSWCNSDFKTSGWDVKVKNFTDYGLPIFLSEWGCIENRPREFEELAALMSPEMTSVYSGGLMYEYTMEANDYGIVKIKSGKAEYLDEFDLFKSALENNPPPQGDGGASSETRASKCPPRSKDWQVDPEGIPAMPKEAEKFMKDGVGKGPGLNGPGSQTAGDSGTATVTVKQGKPSPTGESQSNGDDGEEDAASSLNLGLGSMLVSGAVIAFTLFGAALF